LNCKVILLNQINREITGLQASSTASLIILCNMFRKSHPVREGASKNWTFIGTQLTDLSTACGAQRRKVG